MFLANVPANSNFVRKMFVSFVWTARGNIPCHHCLRTFPWCVPTFKIKVTFLLSGFRRFIWNFFRLENEHLNNCGQFRAVRDISVVPMDTNDQAYLEQMMDDMDGMPLATTRGRANHRRKASVVVKSLRKISSKTDGVKRDTQIVIENEHETRLWWWQAIDSRRPFLKATEEFWGPKISFQSVFYPSIAISLAKLAQNIS